MWNFQGYFYFLKKILTDSKALNYKEGMLQTCFILILSHIYFFQSLSNQSSISASFYPCWFPIMSILELKQGYSKSLWCILSWPLFVAAINSDYSLTSSISTASFALMNIVKMVLEIKLNWNSVIITVQYSTFPLRFLTLIWTPASFNLHTIASLC